MILFGSTTYLGSYYTLAAADSSPDCYLCFGRNLLISQKGGSWLD